MQFTNVISLALGNFNPTKPGISDDKELHKLVVNASKKVYLDFKLCG